MLLKEAEVVAEAPLAGPTQAWEGRVERQEEEGEEGPPVEKTWVGLQPSIAIRFKYYARWKETPPPAS